MSADIIGHLLSLYSSNLHIGRSSKGHISTDNTGRSLMQTVKQNDVM